MASDSKWKRMIHSYNSSVLEQWNIQNKQVSRGTGLRNTGLNLLSGGWQSKGCTFQDSLHFLIVLIGYTCFSKAAFVQTKQTRLWRMCSLVPSMHLTQFSMRCYVRSSREHIWMPPTAAWNKDFLTNGPQFVRLKGSHVWENGQQHTSTAGHWTLTGSLHFVHFLLEEELGLQSSAEILWWPCCCEASVMDWRLSTDNCWITL